MRTSHGFGGAHAGDETDVDTIELELNPEQLRELTQASSQLTSTSTDLDQSPVSNKLRSANTSAHSRAGAAALLLCLCAGIVLFAVERPRVSPPRDQSAVGTVVRAAPRAPSPPARPVRFRNPFDATEVFEFAAGTSDQEARDAVAKLLSDRARERLALFKTVRVHRNRSRSPHTITADNSARLSMESTSLPKRE